MTIRERERARIVYLVGYIVAVAAFLIAWTITQERSPNPGQANTTLTTTAPQNTETRVLETSAVNATTTEADTPPRKQRAALLAEYTKTEREIRALVRPSAPNPDPEYISKLHALIKKNREIAATIGEQESWTEVAKLIETRLPGTLEHLQYPMPED